MIDEIRSDDRSDAEELTTSDLVNARERMERKTVIGSGPTGEQTPSELRAGNPQGTAAGAATARSKVEETPSALFASDEANNLRARWDRVQAAFVDEPRQAVQDADRLVAATMKRLEEMFAEEHQRLEQQWDRGDNVSTEDLRIALRRYRSFFSRLLNV